MLEDGGCRRVLIMMRAPTRDSRLQYNKKYTTSQTRVRDPNTFPHLERAVSTVGDNGGLVDKDFPFGGTILRGRRNKAKAFLVRKPFHSALVLHLSRYSTFSCRTFLTIQLLDLTRVVCRQQNPLFTWVLSACARLSSCLLFVEAYPVLTRKITYSFLYSVPWYLHFVYFV